MTTIACPPRCIMCGEFFRCDLLSEYGLRQALRRLMQHFADKHGVVR